ncbi:MAG: helix-turn-helix domain-containing protein [Aggregatilineales bacterium]
MIGIELDSELAGFPKRLRTARKQMNISQHELARLCGLSINQISRYELGLREPTAVSLIKVARALNVSMDYLVGLTEDRHGLSVAQELNTYEREVIDAFRSEGWSGIARLGVERLSK